MRIICWLFGHREKDQCYGRCSRCHQFYISFKIGDIITERDDVLRDYSFRHVYEVVSTSSHTNVQMVSGKQLYEKSPPVLDRFRADDFRHATSADIAHVVTRRITGIRISPV